MKTLLSILTPALLTAWLVTFPANAKEPSLTVDSVLAKWEVASQKCKTLDAKLTIFHYDGVFGNGQPEIMQGRFYYEAPNMGRYEIHKSKSKTAAGGPNDWSNISEAIIWTGKETLLIQGDRRTCTKYFTAEIKSLLGQPESKDDGWILGILSRFGCELARKIQGPKQMLPLMIGVRAADVRERYHLTIADRGEEIHLKLLPKYQSDAGWFREIEVILNAKTYTTVATQVYAPNGKDRAVYQLSETKINERHSGRDQLMSPDLRGLSITEEHGPAPEPEKNAKNH